MNTLVLDEPTNHLDLEAIEELETALEAYAGCLVVVTHDRRFLERLAGDAYARAVIEIRELVQADWPAAAEIYGEGLDIATFEERCRRGRSGIAGHLISPPRLVARGRRRGRLGRRSPHLDPRVLSRRRHNSIYVARSARGHGVGRALLIELCRRTDQLGIWTIQAGIFVENEPSIALHASCGFRVVGTHERLARKRGTWRDVVLMERRSPAV